MFPGEKIVEKIDENKSLMWGLFLSSQIPGHAIGNIFLVILLVLFLITVSVRKKIVFNRNLLPLLALYTWGATSLLWTTYPPDTLSAMGKTIGIVLLPLIIS